MFYDPMIAKLCTYGPDRKSAIAEMIQALDAYEVSGIAHNINFLNAVCNHPRFQEGCLTTGFIAEEYPEGFSGVEVDDETYHNMAAIAALVELRHKARSINNVVEKVGANWVVSEGLERHTDLTAEDQHDGLNFTIEGKIFALQSDWVPGMRRVVAQINGVKVIAFVERVKSGIRVTHRGAVIDLAVRKPRQAELAKLMPVKEAPDLSKFLLCPMPGMVVSINVEEGDEVKAGHPLAVVEAMKMENILRAEQDGIVSAVKAKAGDTLAVDDVILEFE